MASKKPKKKPAPKFKKAGFRRAKNLCKILTLASYALALLLWIHPTPYEFLVLLTLMVPVLAMGVLIHYKGMVKINNEEDDHSPSITYAVLLPPVAAAGRLFFDYELATYLSVVLISVVLSLGAMVVVGTKVKELSLRSTGSFIIGLLLTPIYFLYFWALIVFANCCFDTTEPQVFAAEVLTKKISEGDRSTSFFVYVNMWGEEMPPEMVEIDEDFYDEVGEGSEVTVYLREGSLSMPWYYISI